MSEAEAPRRDVSVLLSFNFYTPLTERVNSLVLIGSVILLSIVTIIFGTTSDEAFLNMFPSEVETPTYLMNILIAAGVVLSGLIILLCLITTRSFLVNYGHAVAAEIRTIAITEFHAHITKTIKAEVYSAVQRTRRCFHLRPEVLVIEEPMKVLAALRENGERNMMIALDRYFSGAEVFSAQWASLGGPRVMFKEAAITESAKHATRYIFPVWVFVCIGMSLFCGISSFLLAIFMNGKLSPQLYKTMYKSLAFGGLIPAIVAAFILSCKKLTVDNVENVFIRPIMEKFVDAASEEFNSALRTAWTHAVLAPTSELVGELTDEGQRILHAVVSKIAQESNSIFAGSRFGDASDDGAMTAEFLDAPGAHRMESYALNVTNADRDNVVQMVVSKVASAVKAVSGQGQSSPNYEPLLLEEGTKVHPNGKKSSENDAVVSAVDFVMNNESPMSPLMSPVRGDTSGKGPSAVLFASASPNRSAGESNFVRFGSEQQQQQQQQNTEQRRRVNALGFDDSQEDDAYGISSSPARDGKRQIAINKKEEKERKKAEEKVLKAAKKAGRK